VRIGGVMEMKESLLLLMITMIMLLEIGLELLGLHHGILL